VFKNIKNIDKIVYGTGSFDQLDDIIAPKREENNKYFVFLVDDFSKENTLRKDCQ
jgi:3-deoxy-alpha-D-manno-octulosonate 8-oxidase